MFIPDMPNVPPQNVPVMIAQANQAQPGDVTKIRTLGVCLAMTNNSAYFGENAISPLGAAGFYLQQYEHLEFNNNNPTGIVTVLQQPMHGVLQLITSASPSSSDSPDYAYLPEAGYVGKDQATMLVEVNGIKVKVEYFFQAIPGVTGNDGGAEYCAPKGMFWKISSTLDTNGTSTITSVEYQSPTTLAADATSTNVAALASWINTTDLNSNAAGITVNVANLAGAAIGQDTGTNITLDATAAGNGWYINTNPADNSQFLPTSDPNVWIAAPGSAAAGKMDMLSVLLHE